MPTLYDNFERVRQYIDQHQGGGGDMSAYVTKNELSAQSYLTSIPSTYASYNGVYSYLHDTLGISHGGCQGVSYIDAAELHDAELTGDILINGISTDELPTYTAISAMGYVSAVSEGNFDSVINLEGMSKIAAEDGLEIDAGSDFIYLNNQTFVNDTLLSANIIPQHTNTYTLGDNNNYYYATYTKAAYLSSSNVLYNQSSNQVNLDLGNRRFVFASGSFFPSANTNLGKSDRPWANTYTTNLYTDTAYLQDTSYTSSILPKEDSTYNLGGIGAIYRYAYIQTLRGLGTGFSLMLGTEPKYDFYGSSFRPRTNGNINLGAEQYNWAATYTTNIYTENVSYTSGKSSIKLNDRNVDIWVNNKKMVNVSDYNGVVPTQTNVNLGGSSNKWAATYTSNLYADTIHNFIWTGTSAEYAALSDYTTYQIYMIKES